MIYLVKPLDGAMYLDYAHPSEGETEDYALNRELTRRSREYPGAEFYRVDELPNGDLRVLKVRMRPGSEEFGEAPVISAEWEDTPAAN